MSAATRIAVFVIGLGAVFAAALGIGNAVGPVADEPVAHDDEHAESEGEPEAHGGGHGATAETSETAEIPGGLMVSQDGYTFRLANDGAAPGRDVTIEFTIEGPDGRPVTEYDVEHEKRLHLIAVRRDFTGFQHVHPELADGVWSTDLDLTSGEWRLFADFKASGADGLTLGTDLAVSGDYRPAPPSEEVRTARVDGYTVTLRGDLTAGEDARLTLNVSKDGRPVTDLERYLGAYGHLVALREGDLAYLHVHPDGIPGDGSTEPGPDVVFYAAVPSDGGYRLFLDFQHDGVVRTAEFALTAGGSGREADAADTSDGEEGGDDHDH